MALAAACAPSPPPPATPKPRVTVARAERREMTFFVESVGTLDGFINAELRARVRGFVEAQLYNDGAFVEKGAPMFRLDRREYEAALAQAEGNVERALAALARYTAQVERYRPLAAKEAVSRQDLDDALAARRDAQGQVASARGALMQAKLNLSFTDIHAPLAGLAGTARARPGNLVGQEGATLLATVSQLDPMRVSFPLSEVDYIKYRVHTASWSTRDLPWARAQFAAFARKEPGAAQPLTMRLADGSQYPHAGVVVSADRQVDPTTGTIQIQALFPNPERLLRPGQYCRLRLRSREVDARPLLVPERAIREAQGRFTVGVVGDGDVVRLRTIVVGPAAGGQRAVTGGLREGERVVVDGLQRLREGTEVDVEAPAPPAEAEATLPPKGPAGPATKSEAPSLPSGPPPASPSPLPRHE